MYIYIYLFCCCCCCLQEFLTSLETRVHSLSLPLSGNLQLVRLLTPWKISPGCDHCLCKRRPQNGRVSSVHGCRRFRGPINGVSCGRQTSFRRWRGVKRWPVCPFNLITQLRVNCENRLERVKNQPPFFWIRRRFLHPSLTLIRSTIRFNYNNFDSNDSRFDLNFIRYNRIDLFPHRILSNRRCEVIANVKFIRENDEFDR